jgi:hypothetical protein
MFSCFLLIVIFASCFVFAAAAGDDDFYDGKAITQNDCDEFVQRIFNLVRTAKLTVLTPYKRNRSRWASLSYNGPGLHLRAQLYVQL